MSFNIKMFTIKELGKDLSSINLMVNTDDRCWSMIDYMIGGCPKLKSLTLESLRGRKGGHRFSKEKDQDIIIAHWTLEALYKECKEFKDLKLTKVSFVDIFTEDEIKKILPGCNVEIKECEFDELVDDSSDDYFHGFDSSDSDDSYYHGRYYSDSDDWNDSRCSWFHPNNSGDVSFDDGEQDSNDILDHFDGGEIDLMFSQNFGEDNKNENEDDQFMDNTGCFWKVLVTEQD